jgi:hypothetical protein
MRFTLEFPTLRRTWPTAGEIDKLGSDLSGYEETAMAPY